MKRRLVQILGLCLCLECCFVSGMNVTAKEFNVVELLKNEVRKTLHWDEGCSDTTLQLTQHEAECLMKLSTAEGASEGVIGQLKVQQVVMNRVKSPDYPNDVESVIEQKTFVKGKWRYQFCTVREGTYYDAEPDLNAHLALAMLEKNENPDTEIIAFETVTNGDSLLKWFDYAFTYENHNFYKTKKD